MSTIYVPEMYTTLQAAVDVAQSGDVIEVTEGIYNENVNITTSDITLIAHIGVLADGSNTITNAFDIRADDVNIKGFNIKSFNNGIIAVGNNNSIEDCEIIRNKYNAVTISGDDNLITNCILYRNGNTGISIGGNSNTIENNSISTNDISGISFKNNGGTDNLIRANDITKSKYAITLNDSSTSDNTIEDNMIYSVDFGIVVYNDTNTIQRNVLMKCKFSGIQLFGENNSVSSNTIENSSMGITISGIKNNVQSNYIATSDTNGITLSGTGNTLKYNILKDNNLGILLQTDSYYFEANQYYNNINDIISVCE